MYGRASGDPGRQAKCRVGGSGFPNLAGNLLSMTSDPCFGSRFCWVTTAQVRKFDVVGHEDSS